MGDCPETRPNSVRKSPISPSPQRRFALAGYSMTDRQNAVCEMKTENHERQTDKHEKFTLHDCMF